MLTPDYLNIIEFNDVVELYNKLNIEITADIIQRIAGMDCITSTTKDKMKILVQTNGTEIFNKALEKTSLLTAERKKQLKMLFQNMIQEDMQGYKELYEYRGKIFKLSESQYKILNQGLKTTNRILKNLTNTIAFQSKQTYVEAVDKAYMQVVSGAFDYATAINNTVQNLANEGVTLRDKLGRKVQLEVAVRRNVMAGIQQTANSVNRDIEEYLGCDGYEVTAHIGARPTHAEAQGKQYATSKEDSKKYGIGLWSDVSDLWEEYNCRHKGGIFGIILGVSEPVYTNKELEKLKNATVTLNGKQVPYYEATQKQRQLENTIRKQKRAVQTLEKAGQDTTKAKSDLSNTQKKLNDFCKQTGLEKDHSRITVAKLKTNTQSRYNDITNQFDSTKKYEIKEKQYYKAEDGTKYNVDGKHVILNPTTREKEVAEILGKAFGGQVNIIPRINNPASIKTPDYIINNERFDLKEITGKGKYVIEGNLRKKKNQANNFIIDVTNTKMDPKEIERQIKSIYISKRFMWIDKIFVIKENKIINAYKRK